MRPPARRVAVCRERALIMLATAVHPFVPGSPRGEGFALPREATTRMAHAVAPIAYAIIRGLSPAQVESIARNLPLPADAMGRAGLMRRYLHVCGRQACA